jgi:formimidoylglutamate deiminase
MAAGDNVSTGRSLFDAALTGGARALGVAVPGLAAGEPADIVGLVADHPSIVHRQGDAILDGWIFANDRDLIDSVWCGGRALVVGGRHAKRDDIVAGYRRTLGRLLDH